MTTAPAPDTATPPLAANRNFRLLWAGEGVSVLGSMTTSLLFPLIAVTVFDAGPVWMGVLSGAVWLPWLLIGLPAGAWVDRSDPRRVMMHADLVAALAITSVPVAGVLGVLSLVQLATVALVLGCCTVFFRTGYTAIVPRLVRPEDLERATSRVYGTESAMQVAGPGVGGLLAQLASPIAGVVLNTVGFVTSWLCLARMRPAQFRPTPTAAPRQSLGREIGDGVRIVARDPFLRFFTLQGALGNFALTGYGALMVLFLVRDLHLQPSSVGIVMAIGSAGSLLGAWVATRVSGLLGAAGALRWLQLVGGPPALLLGLATPGWAVVLVPLGIFLVGVGIVGANVMRSAFRARYVPADLLGRTAASTAVLNFGTMPGAALTAGVLGDAIGLRETILLMGALNAAGSLLVLIGPFRRGRDLPEGQLDDLRERTPPA